VQAGKLRDQVTINRWLSSADPQWGAGGGWVSMDTIWAGVTPVNGTEKFVSQAVQAEATHMVKVRYRPDITTKDRLLYRNRTLELLSVLDVDGRRRELEIVAKEYPDA
jgi:SPP1 family predicted phage head-tail adaptor